MPTKIRIQLGEVEVEYEGPEEFLNKKLPELINQLTKLTQHVRSPGKRGKGQSRQQSGDPGTLASFLKSKSVTSQMKRFLATAEWLHQRGNKELNTSNVTKALRDSRQSKLANPADCLNKNVNKGYCEKHGSSFYVTDEGRSILG